MTTSPNHAPLSASIIDTHATAPARLVVLCHGFGAPANDMAQVAKSIQQHLPQNLAVRFVLAHGLLTLEEYGMPQGRAWWPIDMAALAARQNDIAGYITTIRSEPFPGMALARRALMQLIERELTRAELSYDQCVLAGFSQGAMLSTEVALRLDEPPKALGILSGTLTDESSWRRLAARRTGLKVVMAHGHTDAILPFDNAVALRDLLIGAGCDVAFTAFDDGHTIVDASLRALAQTIAG